jgi:hypothetical protein
MTRLGWYTRDGHTDFFAKCSQRLSQRKSSVQSFHVCNTRLEYEHLSRTYGIEAVVLSEYLNAHLPSWETAQERIRELEEQHDVPLRKIVWSEMYEKGFSDERLCRLLVAYVEFWEAFLRENKIDRVVSERPSIMATNTLWALCQKHEVPFLEFTNLGIDGRLVRTSAWVGDVEGFEEAYLEAAGPCPVAETERAAAYLEKMTEMPEKPLFILQNQVTGQKIRDGELHQKLPRLGKLTQVASRLKRSRERTRFYINQSLGSHLSSVVLAHVRAFGHRLMNVFETDLDADNERFFLFPLHHLHEWALYPWAELQYPHMIDLLRMVAGSLPLGCKLYVKEHTFFFPEKGFDFYRALRQIPNVKLVDRRANSFELVRRSEGLVTLGGTMGWEAFLLGKPVFALGVAWYRHLPGVYPVDCHRDLPGLLQNAYRSAVGSTEEKLQAIRALYGLSFEATRYPVNELCQDDNIELYMPQFEAWMNDRAVLTL